MYCFDFPTYSPQLILLMILVLSFTFFTLVKFLLSVLQPFIFELRAVRWWQAFHTPWNVKLLSPLYASNFLLLLVNQSGLPARLPDQISQTGTSGKTQALSRVAPGPIPRSEIKCQWNHFTMYKKCNILYPRITVYNTIHTKLNSYQGLWGLLPLRPLERLLLGVGDLSHKRLLTKYWKHSRGGTLFRAESAQAHVR